VSDTTWLTPEAFKKLEEELAELEGPGRIELSERIAEARSHGDIKENADYDAAKNEQGLAEARIRKLRQTIERAEVRAASSDGTVEVGCVVEVKDSDGDKTEFFVAPAENRVAGMVLASPDSPLGAALLGAKRGDEVSYQAPGGTFTYTVVTIAPYKG